MRIMTCQNGLVWQARLAAAEQGRRARFIFVAAIGLGLMVTSARGGSLDAPAGPTDPASAMWTLNDIYNVLNTRTTNVTKRTSFKEPTAGPTSGTMHNLNDIMTLVTNRAPVAKTGQKKSFTPYYDDGWYGTNLGVAWPNPRFTIGTGTVVNTTNCVTDNLTGLMWTRNANIATNSGWGADGRVTWLNAFNVITNLSTGLVNGVSYGGYTDWRMPNHRELLSLIDDGSIRPALCNTAGTGQGSENDPFTGVPSDHYWTSTSWKWETTAVLYVCPYDGLAAYMYKTEKYCVWPVRGGQ